MSALGNEFDTTSWGSAIPVEPIADGPMQNQQAAILASLVDAPGYAMPLAVLRTMHANLLGSSSTELQHSRALSQLTLAYCYSQVVNPGAPLGALLSPLPRMGLYLLGPQEIPAITLAKAFSLRFCMWSAAGAETCCFDGRNAAPLTIAMQYHYTNIVRTIAYGVLSNAIWVEPLWAANCQQTGVQSVGVAGCWWPGAPSKGNYFEPALNGSPSKGMCLPLAQNPRVSLACCSPVGYGILAPVNLAELVMALTPSACAPIGAGFDASTFVPTRETWKKLAHNLVMLEVLASIARSSTVNASAAVLATAAKQVSTLITLASPAFGGPGLVYLA